MRSSKIEWLLRIGVFGIFFGHGMFALLGEANWIPYLTFWGLTKSQAITLMPFIGGVDLFVAIATLWKPNRYILMYAVFWAFSTALMRPLTGSAIWAFVERAGNWVVPLCLLLMTMPKSSHSQDPS